MDLEMESTLLFFPIHWGVNPEILKVGPLAIRWYGLLFASAFFAGFRIMVWIYKREGLDPGEVDRLLIYVMIGTVVGARLGHCLFYEPGYYLRNPLEIIKVWQGGLASHGAAIGILTALYLYSRSGFEQTYRWLLDRVVIVVALSGFFIRLGNLFNSEILGIQTSVPWAFVFDRIDLVPRHPTQLYESFTYLAVFWMLFILYKKSPLTHLQGFLSGLFLTSVFGFRFFVEFLKENQSAFEGDLFLNMGQMLSIPLCLIGLYMMMKAKITKIQRPGTWD